ncbi:glutamate-rich protein 2 isoform X11 [Caretta caretta]|uniref:glutamate-rich protein 2 isoform X11 n=1 Tax=Caretta caretta TaxID=8467 RepID=UPI003F4C252C
MWSGPHGLPGRQPPRWIYSGSLLDNVKAELFRKDRYHKGPKEWTKWQITCVWSKSMDVDQNLQTEFIRQQNKSHYVQLNQLLKSKWDSSAKSTKNKNSSRIQETNLRSPHYIQETTDNKEKNSRNVEKPANNELSTEFQTNSIDDHNIDEQLSETTDDDESSSENEDRKRNAPIELLGEFLKAIMDQDYSLSKKLCQMILIYEPENTEAKQFLPLLEEKLLIESTQNFGDEEGEETDEGSSEDSEEDTSSSDSSDDEGEESSDDSDENV